MKGMREEKKIRMPSKASALTCIKQLAFSFFYPTTHKILLKTTQTIDIGERNHREKEHVDVGVFKMKQHLFNGHNSPV
jgi:hypothetical protein